MFLICSDQFPMCSHHVPQCLNIFPIARRFIPSRVFTSGSQCILIMFLKVPICSQQHHPLFHSLCPKLNYHKWAQGRHFCGFYFGHTNFCLLFLECWASEFSGIFVVKVGLQILYELLKRTVQLLHTRNQFSLNSNVEFSSLQKEIISNILNAASVKRTSSWEFLYSSNNDPGIPPFYFLPERL